MAQRKPQLEAVGINEALKAVSSGLKRQAREPNLYGYQPHSKQLIFHSSLAKKKLYIGGNRSGKTTGAVVEDIFRAKGESPFRALSPAPTRGRCHGVDFINGVQKILLPQFQRWVPPSLLINGSWEDSYNKSERTLNFTNGSFIEFMSYDQDLDKFAGTSRDYNHFDEEPPQHIFNESNARLIDTNGDYYISMTPVDGMTWIYDELYLKGGTDEKMLIVEVDMLENPYISEEAAENYLSTLDKDERAAREHGHFIQLGGRVFKAFSKETHVITPEEMPDITGWEIYRSLDHGFSNPTAWLWHAVSQDNEILTFDEHYKSELTVEEHAEIVNAKDSGHIKPADYTVGDPAIAQRQGVTGTSIQTEYADNGIYIAPGNNDVASGVSRMAQYLRMVPDKTYPRWRILTTCPNLIRELERLRWQTWSSRTAAFNNNKKEKIHKKDDHASDSARYFFTFMPDLTPDLPEGERPKNHDSVMGAVNGVRPTGTYDDVLRRMGALPQNSENHGPQETKWIKQAVGSDVGGLEYDY